MKNRLKGLSKADIIEFFEGYGFEDRLGHPLTRCSDFLDLVDLAVGCQEETSDRTVGMEIAGWVF